MSANQAYYNSAAWKKLRRMVLNRDPVCKTEGCNNASVDVDHIVPLAAGGENSFENLQGLCRSCHSKKTANEPRCDIPTTLVCGPPGAGKTTYVREHMRTGDLVVDMDYLLAALSFANPDNRHASVKRFAHAAVRGVYYEMQRPARWGSNPRHAWVIRTEPDAIERAHWAAKFGGAEIVVLETSPSEVRYRLENSDRKMSAGQIAAKVKLAEKWWTKYTRGDGETVEV